MKQIGHQNLYYNLDPALNNVKREIRIRTRTSWLRHTAGINVIADSPAGLIIKKIDFIL